MFGLFNKKKSRNPYPIVELDTASADCRKNLVEQNFLTKIEGFPRLSFECLTTDGDGELSENLAQSFKRGEVHNAWISAISDQLGNEYLTYESNDFLLVSAADEKYISRFLKSMENIHYRINKALGELCVRREQKLAIFIIDDHDKYYEYISYYYPDEGSFARSSGVFLNDIVPHFVMPKEELNIVQTVAAHELSHAMVAHLRLPLWLDEGIAVNMEASITGSNPFRLNQEKHAKHQAFWQAGEIQEFWSGESFSRPDEGNELSYQLAQLIARSLAEEHDAFYQFVSSANRDDGGEKALLGSFGVSLGDIIENVFGEGDWKPKPESWRGAD